MSRLYNTRSALILITLVALILRVATVDTHGFWVDEVASLDMSTLGFPTFITGRFGYHLNQTPLHYAIVWITTFFADPTRTTIAGRLPSALLGAFTVPVVYGLGKELFGKPQGLTACLLVALSSVHLNYSQDLRPYSALVFFTTFSLYSLLKADKTDSPGWWAAFALTIVANALNSYLALTLAVPVVVTLLAWVLWNKWRNRSKAPRAPGSFVVAVVATLLAMLGLLIAAIDMLGAQRTSPDITKFSLSAGLLSIPELLTWFTQFGLSSNIERLLQLMVFATALVGLMAGVANPIHSSRRQRGAAICALFLLFPPLLLSLLATTGVVFQRYAIFVLPFYFLLVGHGLVALYSLLPGAVPAHIARVWHGAVISLSVVLLLASLYGAYAYEDPQLHANVAFRPDFRGTASYLSKAATPRDTIIFLDDTGHGYTVTNFYWNSKPPTANYDARDPLLFAHRPQGYIYWVTTLEDLSVLDHLAEPGHGWVEVAAFERVRILRETGSATTLESMSRMVDRLSTLLPDYQPVLTLQGSVLQARGELPAAADTYRLAGTFFPIGADYQRTAQGYSNLGNTAYAWRDALLSKYLQPFRPELHRWLAAQLQAENLPVQSQAETELSRLLNTAR